MPCFRRTETIGDADSPSKSPVVVVSWDKFIPWSVDCQKMLRSRRIRLQLLSQFQDLVIYSSSRWIRIISPNFIEQSLACEHTLGTLGKELQKLELVRSEDHRTSAAPNCHFLEVYFTIRESINRWQSWLPLPPDGRLNSCRKLTRTKWLGYIII